jgi:hypothetical protein
MLRLVTLAIGLAAILVGSLPAPAQAQARLALVIGIDRYPNLPAEQQLKKSLNDANAVADALEGLGFQVMRGHDVGRRAMLDLLAVFTSRLQANDIAAVFFAGHGVAIDGSNHLIPADVPDMSHGSEAMLREAAIAEGELVERIQARAPRLTVLVIDAFRGNPFPARAEGRAIGDPRGLLAGRPTPGLFSIYSAMPGQTALDRLHADDTHRNSLFGRVFVEHLRNPRLDLETLASAVGQRVAALARIASVGIGEPPHQQTPVHSNQIGGGQVFLQGPARGGRMSSLDDSVWDRKRPADEVIWDLIQASDNPSEFRDFLQRYPSSARAADARARLRELQQSNSRRTSSSGSTASTLADAAKAWSVPAPSAGPAAPKQVQTRKVDGTSQPTAPREPAVSAEAGAAAGPSARAVLHEEMPDNPYGKSTAGTTRWRIDGGNGSPADVSLHADVDMPQRGVRLTLSLRKNNDASLPASHLIDVRVTSFDPAIANIAGILMKQSEATRGVPLAGLSVKATPQQFMIGLSAVKADMDRNNQLLQTRAWFDVPIVLSNGKRAILAIEKGAAGEQAFRQALDAWGHGSGFAAPGNEPSRGVARLLPPVQTDRPAAAAPDPPLAPSQTRAILYEDVPEDPKGRRTAGSATWRVEDKGVDLGLAADVAIPDRNFRLTLSLRKNGDRSLPASHLIEIQVTQSDADVAQVPGVMMKSGENLRGVPLHGKSVQVTPRLFMIGLSALEADVVRNADVLRNRSWFDIPMVLSTGQRIIVAVEKGAAGHAAFERALAAWSAGQSGSR